MSSTNVVPHPELVSTEHVRVALKELHAAGIIGQAAFCLGVQVLAEMAKHNVRQTIYTGVRATMRYVRVRGSIYAGPLSRDITTYIEALQDLQVRAGLVNDIVEPGEFSRESIRRHFTASPIIKVGKHYGFKTPIYYVLPEVNANEYMDQVRALVASVTSECEAIDIQ